jgi:hypothetical protein
MKRNNAGEVISDLPAALIDCPEEQVVIGIICGMRAEGLGAKAIAKALDAQGIDCRGHCWHDSTIRAIVRREDSMRKAS